MADSALWKSAACNLLSSHFTASQFYFFQIEGDGGKNYFTFLYQVLHSESFWHFGGMNYPFGEHLIFTDAQPLLVALFKLLTSIFPFLDGYLVAMLNFFMLSSVVIAAVYLCKIFKHYRVTSWFAILAAVLIAFFSPQLNRFSGHYALSYAFLFPMVWYYLIIYVQKPRHRTSLLIATIVLLSSFLHLYYLVILGGFVSLVAIIRYINGTRNREMVIHWGIQFLIPCLVVFLFLTLSDSIPDRPDSPRGFLYYRTYLLAVFFPLNVFPFSLIESTSLFQNITFEGKAYLGVFTSATTLFWIYTRISKKAYFISYLGNRPEFYIASVIMLLFSVGVPVILGLQNFTEFLGPVQQFRSLGRFAWPFYFVANVTVFAWIYHSFDFQKIKAPTLLGLIGISLFFIEVVSKNARISNQVNNNISEIAIDSSIFAKTDPARFQAILPLPYFHIGSEWITKKSSDVLIAATYKYSLDQNLPIFSTMLSRTSFNQFLTFMSTVQGNDTTIYSEFNLTVKPFLVLTDTSAFETLNVAERNMLKASSEIIRSGSLVWLELDPEYFRKFRSFNIPGDTLLSLNNPSPNKLAEGLQVDIVREIASLNIVVALDSPTSASDNKQFKLLVEQNSTTQTNILLPDDNLFYIDREKFMYKLTIPVSEGLLDLQLIPYKTENTDLREILIIGQRSTQYSNNSTKGL